MQLTALLRRFGEQRFALAAIVALASAPDISQAGTMNIKRVTSPGGIEAWLVESHANPLIAMRFAFRGGASQDPADRQGLAYFVSGMMDEGAGILEFRLLSGAIADARDAPRFRREPRRDARQCADTRGQQATSPSSCCASP